MEIPNIELIKAKEIIPQGKDFPSTSILILTAQDFERYQSIAIPSVYYNASLIGTIEDIKGIKIPINQ